MHATIEQTKGQTLHAPSAVVERIFEDGVAKLANSSFELNIMEDSQILVAARADQISLAHPGGALIAYSLLQNGWVQLVSLADVFEHAPDSPHAHTIIANSPDRVEKEGAAHEGFTSIIARYGQ